MMMENLVEWRLAGETELLGENLPQRHFVHHKSHLTRPGLEPGRRGGKLQKYILELLARTIDCCVMTVFSKKQLLLFSCLGNALH
jgi:hypothetical protein